eukprot:CAMPEP_0204835816 /NCGR_PEP_ID=MMETSP1346-20131115/23715_1 /ASSEMBLY_ACC=CAM_ASM_000771 /TAXON_ID=215587 /ORGANISM="Aplanochytrium stocchinoi, Strain GSBS06" /LENGTH=429 /DNA_ID=CAMNT_0051970139 /DNA_START=51 /DNA_END=1337 /DNA_ORIENTATION=-
MDMSLHEFERKSYSKPTKCNLCNKFLLGLTKQGMQCSRCHVDVHSGCMIAAKQKFACLNAVQHTAAIPHHPEALTAHTITTTANVMGALTIDSQDDNQSHDFKAQTFTSPTYCSVCTKLLAGVYKQGVRCSYCRLSVHKSCQNAAISSINCDPAAMHERSHGGSNSGADMKAKFRNTTAALGSKAAAAKVKLSNEMKRFREEKNSGERLPMQISAPTNVHQVSGTTKLKDRTLIPISKAQQNPQQYGIKPGAGWHYTTTATPDSDMCSHTSVDKQQLEVEQSVGFFPPGDDYEKHSIGSNLQVQNPFGDQLEAAANSNNFSVLESGHDKVARLQPSPIISGVTTHQIAKPVIPQRPASYHNTSELDDNGFPTLMTLQHPQNDKGPTAGPTSTSTSAFAPPPPPPPPPPVSVLPAGWVELIEESSGSPYY